LLSLRVGFCGVRIGLSGLKTLLMRRWDMFGL